MRFLSRRRRAVVALLLALPVVLLFFAWRAASWRPLVRQITKSSVQTLWFSPDGHTLLLASEDEGMFTLNGADLRVVRQQTRSAGGWRQAQFSDNGLLFVIVGNEVRLMESKTGHIVWKRDVTFSSPTQAAQGENTVTLTISPKGDSLAYSTSWLESGTAFSYRVRDGRVFAEPKGDVGPEGRFYGDLTETMAVSSDGTVAYDADGGGVCLLINGKSVPLSAPTVPQAAEAGALAFSPDGHTLAANYSSNGIVLWNVVNKSVIHVLPGSLADYHAPSVFSSDSKTLAVAVKGGICDVWDVASGQRLHQIPTSRSKITALAFSPDNSHLAIGTSGGQVQLWRLQ